MNYGMRTPRNWVYRWKDVQNMETFIVSNRTWINIRSSAPKQVPDPLVLLYIGGLYE